MSDTSKSTTRDDGLAKTHIYKKNDVKTRTDDNVTFADACADWLEATEHLTEMA